MARSMIATCASATGDRVSVVPLNRLSPSIPVSPIVKTARRLVFSELRGIGKQHSSDEENDGASVSLPENWVQLRLKEALGTYYCVITSAY